MKSQSKFGIRNSSSQKFLLCLLFAALPIASHFAATIALDNTADGTLPPSNTGTALTVDGQRKKAVIFSTPEGGSLFLTDLRFAFRQVTAGPTFNLHVDLMAADGSNIPTGSALASLSETFTVSTTSSFYTFDLAALASSTFDAYVLSPDSRYALVLYSSGGSTTDSTAWVETAAAADPTGQDGFSFIGYQFTNNGGSSWGATTGVSNAVTVWYELALNLFNIGNGNWNTPGLWSRGAVPDANEEVRIGATTPRTATIDSDVNSGAAAIGFGAGETGTVVVTGAGTVWQSNGDIAIGESGTGTLTIESDAEVRADDVVLGKQSGSSGTLNLDGTLTALSLAKGAGSAAASFDGGTLKATADNPNFVAGFAAGDLVLEAGGLLVDSNAFEIAINSPLTGTGGLTKLGTGSLALNATNNYTGGTTVKAGILEVPTGGSILDGNGLIVVGDDSGDSGTMNLSGGTITSEFTVVSADALATGVVNVTAGTWDSTEFYVGNLGQGTLTLSGTGEITSTSTTYIGRNSGAVGLVQVSGGSWTGNTFTLGFNGTGTLEVSGTGQVSAGGVDLGENGSGTVTVSGGSLTSSESFRVGISGTGSMTVSGTGAVAGDSVQLGTNASGNGTLSLDGGTLTTEQISEGAGSGTVTFNGGTLRLSGTQADLFSGFETGDVTLAAGGGTIDTQNFNAGSALSLSGPGGLSKEGSGTLVLSGANTYLGATTVEEGTLQVNGALGNAGVTVAADAILGGTGSIGGSVTVDDDGAIAPGISAGTLTLGGLDLDSDSRLLYQLDTPISSAVASTISSWSTAPSISTVSFRSRTLAILEPELIG